MRTDFGLCLVSPATGFLLPNPYLSVSLSSLPASPPELEKAENEALAMRKQSEGLTKEYDRLLEEHAKLQAAVDGPTDKKEE